MVITVEDYKEIRQRHLEGESQRQIAKQMGISRNTVAKYCKGEQVPWERKTAERESSVLTEDVVEFIEECLCSDEREGVKKQKHTAKRIYNRLVEEKGFTGGESTVRAKVKELKGTLPKVFVPLAFSPGEALQIDWGLSTIYLNGEKVTVNLFCARLCFSCAPIVYAYHRQNQESFLEAFVRVFNFFEGVTEKVIFDNAKVAVKDGFGVNAKKQDGYTTLSAHYGFDAVFCNPSAAHEKGLVENLVGYCRRNFLVPIPNVGSLEELNQHLEEKCLTYHNHHIRGKQEIVGKMFEEEKEFLRALPVYRFETAKCQTVRVSSYSTVRFDSNDYSVPTNYCGKSVSVKGYAERIEVYYQGEVIATHRRCFASHASVYLLEHYLPLLETRKRAVFNAAPVRQNLPHEFIAWLKENTSSHRELMDQLWRCVDEGWENVWLEKEPEPVLPREEDAVQVTPVNLNKYDELVSPKGVQYVSK